VTGLNISAAIYVTYSANGATSGTAPADINHYAPGDSAAVLANTGTLAKTGYTFIGWNTKADGTGTAYKAADTFTISTDMTLYALWSEDRVVTGTQTGGTTSAPVDPDDAGVIGDVITELGDVEISSPASLYGGIIGGDTTSYLKLSQTPTDEQKLGEVKASVGQDNAVVVSFEVNLEKIYSDGKTERIHDLNENVKVTIKLSSEQLAAITNPATARLFWYNPETGALTDMDAVFDLAAGTATFYTNHFSTFLIANVVNENSVVKENPNTGVNLSAISAFAVTALAAATAAVSVALKKKKDRI
jgi:uncharacterized repeat protein (TIGR02543 family)